jgi:hypothetical protein
MFYDIYLYTLCYYICCLLWRMYEMHPALFLKTGCDRRTMIKGELKLNKTRKMSKRYRVKDRHT